jgi:hypothetical protein
MKIDLVRLFGPPVEEKLQPKPIEKTCAGRAAMLIADSRIFVWNQTEEGFEYWRSVVSKLLEISGSGKSNNLSKVGSGDLEEARYLIGSAFTWSRTQEGASYWMEVQDRLRAYAQAGRRP